jgi:hypothetical protein
MHHLSRRNFTKATLALAVAQSPTHFCFASDRCDTKVHIGAIRWDAWYDPDGRLGQATAAELSPPEYRFRLPFFAKILNDHQATIDGNHQDIIDKEIKYAVDAGLTYWAFTAYLRNSSLSNALKLYINSLDKQNLNFCMLSELTTWADVETAKYHIELMSNPSYQTVLNGRPLYFLGFIKDAYIEKLWGGCPQLKQAIDQFRAKITDIKGKSPYIVILDFDPVIAATYAHELGCDAISSYAINHNIRSAPFSKLVQEAKTDWEERAATGVPVIPTITTGFDKRPRLERPWPWLPSSNVANQLPFYYETAKANEIQSELVECLNWIRDNPKAVPSQTALVYAWNENDEGGWMVPTYPKNTDRLAAMRTALCPPG